ncbi:hypothetical protein GE09DRAFT_632433 [Coniochaeta sp. 2T2.1]|nr:hypothetical protein GE09DRAFT_632433 [Coniochaeta sp. 2T2.1]
MSSSSTCLIADTSQASADVMETTDNTIASRDDAVKSGAQLRDYWKEALSLLEPKARQILEEARPVQLSAQPAGAGVPDQVDARHVDALSDWPETLLDVCKKLESEYEERRSAWHFCFLGRSIKVRDILDGFIKLLEKTKKIGDLASAADPVHAGLPWAVIRALLMVTTANSQQAGALYTGLEEVVRLLNRGFALRGTYR